MTVVATWYEPFDKIVWCVSDTRVSRPGPTAGTITDGGAKILPLSVRTFLPGESGFFDRNILSTTVGFAYAGATLPALMTYAVANTFLQHLYGMPGSPPPRMDD